MIRLILTEKNNVEHNYSMFYRSIAVINFEKKNMTIVIDIFAIDIRNSIDRL